MSSLNVLLTACQAEPDVLQQQARERIALWESWLRPISDSAPTGSDPGYDDDFQQMREEVNKLSGADTELVCQLAEKLLTNSAKDIRVATYYCWAKLHREGERGLADGLELLAGLLEGFGSQLHPQRDRSRKAALEWLASSRMIDSLSLYPEVVREEALHTVGALLQIAQITDPEPDETRPELGGLYSALESRLQKAGGVDAVVPQNVSDNALVTRSDAPEMSRVTSGQDLLAQRNAVLHSGFHSFCWYCPDIGFDVDLRPAHCSGFTGTTGGQNNESDYRATNVILFFLRKMSGDEKRDTFPGHRRLVNPTKAGTCLLGLQMRHHVYRICRTIPVRPAPCHHRVNALFCSSRCFRTRKPKRTEHRGNIFCGDAVEQHGTDVGENMFLQCRQPLKAVFLVFPAGK